jgi:RNA polymerase-binding transcription factor
MRASPAQVDLEHVRAWLVSRRADTQARVASLARRPELGTPQDFGERIGDGTVEAVSRLTEIGVGESLEAVLARIERALAKLDEGSYGRCDSCGEAIDPARLRVKPDSSLCMRCAAGEARRPPPGRR